MNETTPTSDARNGGGDKPACDAELHVRLCARRARTGHLQFHWRIEDVDNIHQMASSLDGSFGPFQLPHECGQELAAAVRQWMKDTTKRARDHALMSTADIEGVQLTLSEGLLESESGA